MITVSNDKVFSLSNSFFSYVFRVTPEGLLEHIYYGAPLSRPLDIAPHHIRTERACTTVFEGVPHLNLSDLPQEFPTFGRSDFRMPAFHGRNGDGNSVFTLLYKAYRISGDKPSLEGLPSARGGDSQTLIITLIDALHSLEVELFYTVYDNHGVLARSVKVSNHGERSVDLEHIYSSALDLPADDYELLHLHGTWSREFNVARMDMPKGRFVVDSNRGTSSAAHNPFLAVMERGANEDHGSVYGSTLVYSGNFAMSVEQGEFEELRVLTGINPFNFCWRLEAGASFTTPEALHVFSANGLRAMSHIWHDFIRAKILPARFAGVARPTYLNTWEAAYFDVIEDKVLSLADKAAAMGVDMVVLDDGWFEGRNDDTSSLGDWRADTARFPTGIPALAAKIKAKGLKFGIWFEPEMVNPDSELYRKHPDWALHIAGRTPSLGRNQLTLDLTRADVRDYIFGQIDAVLSCGDIDYVKWDMNRNMTELGSARLAAHQYGEVSHRYMLGLYELLTRMTSKYPDIIFENCASGGNRFDLGMLSFMPQGWISDMCDPIGRLDIINGASLLYPLDTIAAYIGPSPNHQNGRISTIQTRFLAGIFCAAKGISLNEQDIDAHEGELTSLMKFAKDTAQDFIGGRFDRLIKTDNATCWQYSCREQNTVYVAYFHTLAAPNLPFARARLVGLDPHTRYNLKDTAEIYYGDALMQSGLALPYVTTAQVRGDIRYMPRGDFSAFLFTLEKLD